MSNPLALAALVAAGAVLAGLAVFVALRTRRSRRLPGGDRSGGSS